MYHNVQSALATRRNVPTFYPGIGDYGDDGEQSLAGLGTWWNPYTWGDTAPADTGANYDVPNETWGVDTGMNYDVQPDVEAPAAQPVNATNWFNFNWRDVSDGATALWRAYQTYDEAKASGKSEAEAATDAADQLKRTVPGASSTPGASQRPAAGTGGGSNSMMVVGLGLLAAVLLSRK